MNRYYSEQEMIAMRAMSYNNGIQQGIIIGIASVFVSGLILVGLAFVCCL